MKTMSNKAVLRMLSNAGACEDARIWVKQHGGGSAELWRDCRRGDWMNWIIVKQATLFGITKPRLVDALADCAALSLKYYEAQYPNDKRVRDCIKTCRAYAKGKATEEELESAADAAHAAAHAAHAAAHAAYVAADAAHAAYAAAYAAYAAADAAHAAYAADAAADAADAAAHAAYAAAYAAYASADAAHAADAAYAAYASDAAYAAYAAARIKTLKQCANILRKHFPELMEKG